MLTKKQLKILGIFQRKIDRKINWKELKELSSEKSSSVIQRAVKAFLEEELIYEEKIGTSKRYNLNLNNPKIFSYFEIYNLEKLPKKVIDILKEIEERISKYTSFYSIVIFGSYSSGEQKKDSDLDLAIFIENERKRKDVENVLKSMEIRSLIKIDGHVINEKEFLEMLKVDYENLGKEIFRKHSSVYNSQIFYSLIKKGIENGAKL